MTVRWRGSGISFTHSSSLLPLLPMCLCALASPRVVRFPDDGSGFPPAALISAAYLHLNPDLPSSGSMTGSEALECICRDRPGPAWAGRTVGALHFIFLTAVSGRGKVPSGPFRSASEGLNPKAHCCFHAVESLLRVVLKKA